eukprot:jgi/Bigna1/83113/fgenesh1_pg.102_\
MVSVRSARSIRFVLRPSNGGSRRNRVLDRSALTAKSCVYTPRGKAGPCNEAGWIPILREISLHWNSYTGYSYSPSIPSVFRSSPPPPPFLLNSLDFHGRCFAVAWGCLIYRERQKKSWQSEVEKHEKLNKPGGSRQHASNATTRFTKKQMLTSRTKEIIRMRKANKRRAANYADDRDRETLEMELVTAKKEYVEAFRRRIALKKEIEKAKAELKTQDGAAQKLINHIIRSSGDPSGRLEQLRLQKILQVSLFAEEAKALKALEKERRLLAEAKTATKKGMKAAGAKILKLSIRDYNRMHRFVRDNLACTHEGAKIVFAGLEAQIAEINKRSANLNQEKMEAMSFLNDLNSSVKKLKGIEEAKMRRKYLKNEINLRRGIEKVRADIAAEQKKKKKKKKRPYQSIHTDVIPNANSQYSQGGQRSELLKEFCGLKAESINLRRTHEQARVANEETVAVLRKKKRQMDMQIASYRESARRLLKTIADLGGTPDGKLLSPRGTGNSITAEVGISTSTFIQKKAPKALNKPMILTAKDKREIQRLNGEIEGLRKRRSLLGLAVDLHQECQALEEKLAKEEAERKRLEAEAAKKKAEEERKKREERARIKAEKRLKRIELAKKKAEAERKARAEAKAAADKKAAEEEEAARKKEEEEAARKKKEEEEAAAAQKKKDEEEAAAKKKKEEEAAARKKKEEEAAARKKKDEEEAAKRKKKEEEEKAAAQKQKEEEEAAARKKKEEEEAAERKKDEEAAAARKKREEDETEAARKKKIEAERKKKEEEESSCEEEEGRGGGREKEKEEAAARKKREEEEAAARKRKEEEEAAERKKKEEEAAVQKKAAAEKVQEEEEAAKRKEEGKGEKAAEIKEGDRKGIVSEKGGRGEEDEEVITARENTEQGIEEAETKTSEDGKAVGKKEHNNDRTEEAEKASKAEIARPGSSDETKNMLGKPTKESEGDRKHEGTENSTGAAAKAAEGASIDKGADEKEPTIVAKGDDAEVKMDEAEGRGPEEAVAASKVETSADLQVGKAKDGEKKPEAATDAAGAPELAESPAVVEENKEGKVGESKGLEQGSGSVHNQTTEAADVKETDAGMLSEDAAAGTTDDQGKFQYSKEMEAERISAAKSKKEEEKNPKANEIESQAARELEKRLLEIEGIRLRTMQDTATAVGKMPSELSREEKRMDTNGEQYCLAEFYEFYNSVDPWIAAGPPEKRMEMRLAEDGHMYALEEFVEHYDFEGVEMWHIAADRRPSEFTSAASVTTAGSRGSAEQKSVTSSQNGEKAKQAEGKN